MDWTNFWLTLNEILKQILYGDRNTVTMDHTNPLDPPVIPPPVVPRFQWDTKDHIRHSVRVVCDDEGLTLEQKDTLCATIAAESGFNTQATHKNTINGKVVSTDYGLCQWNDSYHAKEITPDESLNNPEKAVRLMCKYWKRGQRKLWIAYRSGAYKKYL